MGANMAAQPIDQGDFEFLPVFYDIIKSVETTSHTPKDSQEACQRVLELQRKLEHAREVVRRLPGVEHSKDEQLQQIDVLRKQLALKRDLLAKYRSLASFEREPAP